MSERLGRLAVFVLCLVPFALLLWQAVGGGLGPDPAKRIMLQTGEWSLRLLALTLLVSPLRQWSGKAWVMRLRRMLGLYAFFYACVHLLAFGHFYLGWSPAILVEELAERPYITVGFAAWLLLVPLAVTSTRNWQRRLRRNWQRLHRLIYPAAVLACLHLLWQARSDVGEALVYIVVVGLLLVWRLQRGWRRAAKV
ncbi:sulfite oxidase heme-binding subunit YedZ [Parahaliea aestuarii]|uniref:Protein-methionine-sulfoxide reductase heme-binding subunit MsrQ n=1 Tax=Parahaliea aestuarii TaxID=1852021 RepID=A0A5C8ZQF2_9GAMM|nr:protein-methionine-sulfoxide reductase heme-binding subunit MsrQ [Parahaliea aestuarii]TXS89922.1 sulfoxide reductase heme-binding subunit YedZ [Parahaliea aestuarii]